MGNQDLALRPLRQLYPPVEPRVTFRLQVDELHALYVEECGNPNGLPVVFLHGGPGGGISPRHRRFFDPARYRIILFDQRGAGQSTPRGELRSNTTAHLVSDIEAIRRHLEIDRWVVFGGSWGSLLALAYAQEFPERVIALILRGMFMGTDEEIRWLNERDGGARHIFPERWSVYETHVPEAERENLIEAYWRRLNDPDPAVQIAAGLAWHDWASGTSTLAHDPVGSSDGDIEEEVLAGAKIEVHYFRNGCFLGNKPLINGIERVLAIPATLIHGRYDMICPMKTAHDLVAAWPALNLRVVLAGHSAFDAAIVDALVDATTNCADWFDP
jgi:proline iminopeptidase